MDKGTTCVAHGWPLSCQCRLNVHRDQTISKQFYPIAQKTEKIYIFQRQCAINCKEQKACSKIWNIQEQLFNKPQLIIDPPGHGRIGGHYFTQVSVRTSTRPSVRPPVRMYVHVHTSVRHKNKNANVGALKTKYALRMHENNDCLLAGAWWVIFNSPDFYFFVGFSISHCDSAASNANFCQWWVFNNHMSEKATPVIENNPFLLVSSSIPTFQYLAKQNKVITLFATGETVGLAEWIIDDTCLAYLNFEMWKFVCSKSMFDKCRLWPYYFLRGIRRLIRKRLL